MPSAPGKPVQVNVQVDSLKYPVGIGRTRSGASTMFNGKRFSFGFFVGIAKDPAICTGGNNLFASGPI
jgi:hypothetical protein